MAIFTRRKDQMGVFDRKTAREKNREPRISAMVVFTLAAFLAGAVTLATWTTIPELARATGEITTLGRAYQVETINSGVVNSVLVKEGQQVSEGQILATLTSPSLERNIRSVQQQYNAVLSRTETLSSILEHLDRPDKDRSALSRSSEQGEDYVSSRLYLHELQKEISRGRAESLRVIIERLENAEELMQSRVVEKEASVDRLLKLFESGSITRVRLDAEQQSLDELRGRLIDARIELATTSANYTEVRDKPLESDLALREQTLTQLFDLLQERDALATQLAALEDQREELLVRAPSGGVIQSVDFPRIGEIVEAGATIFELINTNDQLVAEIKVGEADIGHIRRGDKVSLKLTTFDSRRYGEVTGTISSLSPTVVVDPQDGQVYFRGVVELHSLTIGAGEFEKPLRVGMTGSAEIVTDERSMLAYLAKPVYRSLERAFGER
ncbi:HlyD family type I secretion periplasmic adaptor subunit [Roseobacter sp.]|uniref:HlyD family type I secretion periplasmic adaptor subunit n=1 Tax=Roseobacter sp. TaxID=1907202 RepID=UPI002966B61F|nr:HlyD family type I secretion periplasmic adaptor subunit [Roseobacter sp.]MDW3180762.1 HlyD family type I secretion periplasmic adaptor subunit [Roseobacter sp.]